MCVCVSHLFFLAMEFSGIRYSEQRWELVWYIDSHIILQYVKYYHIELVVHTITKKRWQYYLRRYSYREWIVEGSFNLAMDMQDIVDFSVSVPWRIALRGYLPLLIYHRNQPLSSLIYHHPLLNLHYTLNGGVAHPLSHLAHQIDKTISQDPSPIKNP